MGVFGLFKSKSFNPEVFEKELTDLTQRISKTQQQIHRLSRKKHQLLHQIVSTLALLYVIFVGYQYQKVPKDVIGRRSKIVLFFQQQSRRNLLIISLFPVAVYLLWLAINWLFQFVINSRKSLLEKLKEKHNDKIEELKKITNFNKTNELITKYGKPDPKNAPLPQRAPQPQRNPQNGGTNPQNPQTGTINRQNPQNDKINPENPSKQLPQPPQLPQVPPSPQQPTVRTFQDRMLDYIIGSDNNESVETRYALICSQCYTHNGLAPPGCTNPLEISYICPKCGFINGLKKPEAEEQKIEEQKIEEQKVEEAVDEAIEAPDQPINQDNGEAEPIIPHEIEKHPDIIASSIRRNSHTE